MALLTERIECKELLDKLMPVEEAVKFVSDRCKIAISGFTKTGEPKTFLPALARYLQQYAPKTKIGLFSGASLSENVEDPIASFVGKRGPYMSSTVSRKMINAGEMDFTDVHLSSFARNLAYGFYGGIDLAVVEVSRIRPDGSVILSGSVGISAEALKCSQKDNPRSESDDSRLYGISRHLSSECSSACRVADSHRQCGRPGRHPLCGD